MKDPGAFIFDCCSSLIADKSLHGQVKPADAFLRSRRKLHTDMAMGLSHPKHCAVDDASLTFGYWSKNGSKLENLHLFSQDLDNADTKFLSNPLILPNF